jgi:hypothetical protein
MTFDSPAQIFSDFCPVIIAAIHSGTKISVEKVLSFGNGV